MNTKGTNIAAVASAKPAPAKPTLAKSSPTKPVPAKPTRQFANRNKKPAKKNFFTSLGNSSGTIIGLGFLMGATGLICLIPFRNQFSKIMLLLGFVLFIFGFFVKLVDIIVKVIGGRR